MVDFAVPADHRVKVKETEKKDEYLDFARELKKPRNTKVTVIPIVIGVFGSHQTIDSRTGGLEKKRTSEDHLNCSIIEIGQNTEKSPGDLKRVAVAITQKLSGILRYK